MSPQLQFLLRFEIMKVGASQLKSLAHWLCGRINPSTPIWCCKFQCPKAGKNRGSVSCRIRKSPTYMLPYFQAWHSPLQNKFGSKRSCRRFQLELACSSKRRWLVAKSAREIQKKKSWLCRGGGGEQGGVREKKNLLDTLQNESNNLAAISGGLIFSTCV